MNPWLRTDRVVGASFGALNPNQKFSVIVDIYRRMDGGLVPELGQYKVVMQKFGTANGLLCRSSVLRMASKKLQSPPILKIYLTRSTSLLDNSL
jgi:hypothetical protein